MCLSIEGLVRSSVGRALNRGVLSPLDACLCVWERADLELAASLLK